MEGEKTQEQMGRMNQELNSVWGQGGSALPSSLDHAQEKAWIAESQRGDTMAFNRLVLKWERAIYNVAMRMLQDRDDAAEAAQEVFLLAYRNIRRFRQDAKFSTWLYRIAINHCISRARRRPQGTHVTLDGGSPGTPPPMQLRVMENQEGELLQEENRNRVLSALAFLPPEQRAVVELKFFQELTFEDIAAVLQVPLSTIKSRLYSGLEMMKVRLGGRA
jgi:RNA polymerase sigma-70 factor (ECF subfamily)